ncbi:MAG TPA: rhomboid-like protein [Frankiaceae bacterium]|nr:rhomboid-like protein [Frankiaceae bacterium]
MADISSRATGVMRRAVRLVAGSDVALIYGAIVVVVAVALQLLPDSVHDDVVLNSSTNLVNLREHPIYVLLVSAFVVSNLAGLWMVPWLMLTYAATQRWLGRLATVFAALLGHVGATLFVAVLLSAGIWHQWIPPAVAHEPDVGVSYGLACLAGLLVMQVPRRWRGGYVGLVVLFFAGPLILRPTFTDVGHTTALVMGFGLALLAARAAAASGPGHSDGPSVPRREDAAGGEPIKITVRPPR